MRITKIIAPMGAMNAAIAPSSDLIQQLKVWYLLLGNKLSFLLTIHLFHNVCELFQQILLLLELLDLTIKIITHVLFTA